MAKKQWGEMTSAQLTLYEMIKKAGESGLSVSEMMNELGVSRAAVYNHLKVLVEYGRVAARVKRREGQVVYAANKNSVMHMLPGAGPSMPSLPVAEYLIEWLRVTDVNETGTIKAFKRFPYYLSTLAQFAARWNSDDPKDRPFRDEQNELRQALHDVSVRAKLMHEMAQSLLDSDELWSSQKAYHSWYEDAQNVFTVANAKRIHDHIMEVCAK